VVRRMLRQSHIDTTPLYVHMDFRENRRTVACSVACCLKLKQFSKLNGSHDGASGNGNGWDWAQNSCVMICF
jgi:hypothetical protein